MQLKFLEKWQDENHDDDDDDDDNGYDNNDVCNKKT